MVMVVMVEQVVTLELVVEEHLVVMFMMVLHQHGLSVSYTHLTLPTIYSV